MNDNGVSPVIGCMLMVAITVILAAVIAAFISEAVVIPKEDRIAGTVIDRYSYDGVNLFIDIRSHDASGAVIVQTLWTEDPVLFHHIYSGEDYIFITTFPDSLKYPKLIGVR